MKNFMNVLLALCALSVNATEANAQSVEFQSTWASTPNRVWIGPEYWANPMEDWRIDHGRLECIHQGRDRNVHLLTYQLGPRRASFRISVLLGRLDAAHETTGSAGFRIGARDEIADYRAAALRGRGIEAGITADGKLFIDDQQITIDGSAASIQLTLTGKPTGATFKLQLTAANAENNEPLGVIEKTGLPEDQLVGNLALVQNTPVVVKKYSGARYWFRNWQLEGPKFDHHPNHTFGPILWAMHTLSDGVLKMTAQMPPIGSEDSQVVVLEVQQEGNWVPICRSTIDPLSRTASFRVEKWNSKQDVPYRLVYKQLINDDKPAASYYTGTVRREPIERDVILAGFTGNTDAGFPNREIVGNVASQDPDILFFSGDQIYEDVGGYRFIRKPLQPAVLNYLRKWYLFGWAFGDLMRDRVTVCLPDDHDVYQGNLWGNGGNSVPSMDEHEEGGYVQSADFVNVVHRTQTSHHPDSSDSAPIKQGITSFHSHLRYGRISFAIIADRMFKSGPAQVATWPGRPDHVRSLPFDPKSIDKPGLKLLGDRQLNFLRKWARDWRNADLKCVLSQTIFCNLANYHGRNRQYLVADLDSNGWPQTARNNALREIRKSFALHIAGDQHLASIVRYGIDDWNDAGFSFCVPSIAAGYPRRWIPDIEGKPVQNRSLANLPNTGEYIDGLGNLITVHAIGNPEDKNRQGRLNRLHDKASGYGIVRFHKDKASYTLECWRLLVDVTNPKPGDQFPGWPKTINLLDNYVRDAKFFLPTVQVEGLDRPVIQVINETTGNSAYTLRSPSSSFQPTVLDDSASYTIVVSDPEKNWIHRFQDVKAEARANHRKLIVNRDEI